MIYKEDPKNWLELQEYVKKTFVNCGYSAESPKVIETARSEKLEIDVFVEIEGVPKQRIICECKYWDTNIPQAVVHAFRMQANDSGANMGLLISKKGFQSGAIEAARFSNVKLLTWAEFEKMYEKMWYKEFFIPHLFALLDPLIEYIEPINSRIFRKANLLSDDKKTRFNELRQQYTQPAMFLEVACCNIMYFDKLKDMFSGDEIVLELPLRTSSALAQSNCFPESILNCSSYEELLTALTLYITHGINEFDTVFGERA
ncbi:MAG: restriction endonuclease [Oscillospiraceae bacterium]|nr:restriction endonuclease [Oscillospiraceae bacterium]